MRGVIYLIIITILLANGVYACDNNQININDADKEELTELTGIGEVKAQEIIKSRPFDSVDDLIDVWGIGEITLDKIKNQNLACVEGEESSSENGEKSDDKSDIDSENVNNNGGGLPTKKEDEKTDDVVKEVIKLNSKSISTTETLKESKDIKTRLNTGLSYSEGKVKYIIYGFVSFSVLLIVLFLIKKRDKKYDEIV
jgi:competence ComEA-like helix-hairpin-helix protein